MNLPNQTAIAIRKYEKTLLNKDYSYNIRLYTIYILLYNYLDYIRKEIYSVLNNKEETESEIYLFVDKVYKKHDRRRSSLVIYIQKYLPLLAKRYIDGLKKQHTYRNLLTESDKEYILPEEYYLSVPKILYENKYLGRVLTRDEKYLVCKILLAEEEDLSNRNLSKELGLSRENLRTRITSLRDKINGGFNVTRPE